MSKKRGALQLLLCVICGLSTSTVSTANAQESTIHNPVAAPTRRPTNQVRQPGSTEKNRPKLLERSAPPAASAGTQPSPGGAQNEVTKFQGWAVTCFPPPAAGGQKSCIAKMNILRSNEDRRPILLLNVLKSNNETKLFIQTPTGIDLKAGVTLQIGQAPARHLEYSSCEPALCTAVIPMDDIFANELGSFPTGTASWTGLGVGEVRVQFALQEARSMLSFLATR